jgi:anthranilate synthase/aminodeoxychorismate synthase-like glutamine amidotransferase
MKVVIIDNYDSFTYNLYQMLYEVGADNVEVFRNDEIDMASLLQLKPGRIVLSPGPGHPAVDGDFGVCKDIIKQATKTTCPILGICLGHQGIVEHLGGKVTGAPQIVHGKSSTINVIGTSPLFRGLPDSFLAMRYHSLIASELPFPEELCITAREQKDNLIMAVQHKTKPIYGLQFHPESIGTPLGIQILRNFIEQC